MIDLNKFLSVTSTFLKTLSSLSNEMEKNEYLKLQREIGDLRLEARNFRAKIIHLKACSEEEFEWDTEYSSADIGKDVLELYNSFFYGFHEYFELIRKLDYEKMLEIKDAYERAANHLSKLVETDEGITCLDDPELFELFEEFVNIFEKSVYGLVR